jgi:hypothetical protein
MLKNLLFNKSAASAILQRRATPSLLSPGMMIQPSYFSLMTLTQTHAASRMHLMRQSFFGGVQPRFNFIARAPQGLSEL